MALDSIANFHSHQMALSLLFLAFNSLSYCDLHKSRRNRSTPSLKSVTNVSCGNWCCQVAMRQRGVGVFSKADRFKYTMLVQKNVQKNYVLNVLFTCPNGRTHACPTDKISCLGRVDTVFFAPWMLSLNFPQGSKRMLQIIPLAVRTELLD